MYREKAADLQRQRKTGNLLLDMKQLRQRKQGWVYPAKDEKIVILLWAFWPDNRPHDMGNLHKLLPDALENILYENDRNVLIRDMDFSLDKKRPRIEVVVAYKKELDDNETQH